jgi:hypothetical protein
MKKLLLLFSIVLGCSMGFSQTPCSSVCGNPLIGTNKTTCCPGNCVTIGVSPCIGTNSCGSGSPSYSWAPSGGAGCTASVCPTTTTTYTLYITYPGSCCCDGASGSCDVGFTCGTAVRQSTVKVTVGSGCCESVDPGDFRIKNESGIKIFPNPGSDLLYVTFPNLSSEVNTTLVIYDANGKMVSNIDIEDASKQIDIQSFSSGIYYVRVIQGDLDLMFEKFIKK